MTLPPPSQPRPARLPPLVRFQYLDQSARTFQPPGLTFLLDEDGGSRPMVVCRGRRDREARAYLLSEPTFAGWGSVTGWRSAAFWFRSNTAWEEALDPLNPNNLTALTLPYRQGRVSWPVAEELIRRVWARHLKPAQQSQGRDQHLPACVRGLVASHDRWLRRMTGPSLDWANVDHNLRAFGWRTGEGVIWPRESDPLPRAQHEVLCNNRSKTMAWASWKGCVEGTQPVTFPGEAGFWLNVGMADIPWGTLLATPWDGTWEGSVDMLFDPSPSPPERAEHFWCWIRLESLT